MYSILKNILLACTFLLVFSGCGEDNPINTNVTEVTDLYSPENEYSVTLEANGTESFEWAPAKAEDGGMVMYEVAFDEVGGDFSDPFYRLTSGNNGVDNRVTISHEVLNTAAAQAGLEAEETGQMDWTVITSRGVNEQIAETQRTIQVTRLAGIANPPTNLYITGGGTEAGGDLENAMQLKSIGDGEFEIFTELTTDGSFKFVNNTSDSPREFIIEDGTITESGSAPTIEQGGVYRIRMNFTTGSASMTQITNVEFYSGAHDEYLYELDYQEEGTFSVEGVEYSFFQADWGTDSRYKFRLTVSQDGEESYEWWGNNDGDVSRPNNSTPDSYWYLYPVPESADQWQYSYKFNEEEMDNSIIDVHMYFQPDIENYTHEVVKVGDQ